MSFRRWPDERCLRGLTFNYGFEGQLDLGALRRGIDLPMMEGAQSWGETEVKIWVLPKRFELRIGVRPGVVQMLHRVSAPMPQREADRRCFEAALAASLSP